MRHTRRHNELTSTHQPLWATMDHREPRVAFPKLLALVLAGNYSEQQLTRVVSESHFQGENKERPGADTAQSLVHALASCSIIEPRIASRDSVSIHESRKRLRSAVEVTQL